MPTITGFPRIVSSVFLLYKLCIVPSSVSRKTKFLLSFSSVIFALLILEITARLLPASVIVPLDCFQKDQTYNHVHIPGKTCQFKTPTWNVTYTINSKGQRDKEYPLEKPSNTDRILALGDSYTEGWGLKTEDSWPKQLEKALNSQNTRQNYQVINAGVAGYSTSLEYLYLKDKGLNFQPDLVILLFDMSDFTEEEEYAPLSYFDPAGNLQGIHSQNLLTSSQSLYMEMLRRSAEKPILKGWPGTIEYFIRFHLALARKILPVSKDTIVVNPYFFKPQTDAFTLVEKRLIEINNLLQSKNIKFLLVTFPRYDQIENKNLAGPLSVLDQFAKDRQIPVLDLTAAFDIPNPNENYLTADLHFSQAGSQVVAAKIADYLKSQGKNQP